MPQDGTSQLSGKRLGELLLDANVISEGQLGEALEEQAKSGGFIGQILVELKFVQESDLITFLVKQCKIPHVNLFDYEVRPDLVELISKDLCLKHGLVPIDHLGTILTVAMVDPLDMAALEEIRAECPELRIKPILCSWNEFQHVTRRLFKQEEDEPEEMSMDTFGLANVPSKSTTNTDSKSVAERETGEVDEGPIPDAILDDPTPLDPVRALLVKAQDQIRESIRFGMAKILDTFREELASSKGELSLTSEQFTLALDEAVTDAIEEGVGALMLEMEEALSRVRESANDLSTDELAALIRGSVREGIRDASGDTIASFSRLFTPNDPV